MASGPALSRWFTWAVPRTPAPTCTSNGSLQPLVGLLATADAPSGVDGLFYGGGFDVLGRQAVATLAVATYSFLVTLVIAKVIDLAMGLRVDEKDELQGLTSPCTPSRATTLMRWSGDAARNVHALVHGDESAKTAAEHAATGADR